MKRKTKTETGVTFEADSEGNATPVASVPFDYGTVYATDEQVDIDAVSHGQTRAEAEAKLKALGLSKAQREVFLAWTFERKRTRAIAGDIGMSKTWVAKTLKRVEALRGEPVPPPRAPKPGVPALAPLPPIPLKMAMEHARQACDRYAINPSDAGHIAAGIAELSPATASEQEKAVAAVSCWPQLLTHPKAGPPLAKKLADVMTKARYGSKAEAKSARATLAILTRYRNGNRCPIPDAVLGSESLAILVTVADLQRAWRDRSPRESRTARVEAIREHFPETVAGITDKELLPRLQGDLLPASAWFAEKATGIAAEAFVRAWRLIPEVVSLQESCP